MSCVKFRVLRRKLRVFRVFVIMQLKKEMASHAGPPGYDETVVDTTAKPKTKSVKRNERKKEKRIQVCPMSGYGAIAYTLFVAFRFIYFSVSFFSLCSLL